MPLATRTAICWMNGQKTSSVYSGHAEMLAIPLKKNLQYSKKYSIHTHTHTHTHEEADSLKAEKFNIACVRIFVNVHQESLVL